MLRGCVRGAVRRCLRRRKRRLLRALVRRKHPLLLRRVVLLVRMVVPVGKQVGMEERRKSRGRAVLWMISRGLRSGMWRSGGLVRGGWGGGWG